MSVKVYEVAGALHKGTEQVFSDLQKLGASVRRYGDAVKDQDILRLAEQYGRKDYVLSLLSNDSISELAKTWTEEELMKLLLDVDWSNSLLSSKDAGRVLGVKAHVPSYVEQVSNCAASHKNPKALRALYLVGNDKNAIGLPKEGREIQVFLIPKDKKEEVPCCICLDKETVIHTKINIKSCMLLIWADGTYFYEPAPFTKMQDKYYFELENVLKENGVEAVQYEEVRCSSKGIWAMTQWIQAGKSGFAMQYKEKCIMKLDKGKLNICSGTVDMISWSLKETKKTMKECLEVRQAIDALLKKNGMLDFKAFQEEESRLLDVMKVTKIYTDDFLDENSDERIDLAIEGYVRLRILEEQGLSSKVVQAFAKERKIFMSRGVDGSMPLQDRFLEKRIQKFEEEQHAVAYYCVVAKEKRETVANIFYVSECREKWEEEREALRNKKVIVYQENLSNKERSKVGTFQFCIINGGII